MTRNNLIRTQENEKGGEIINENIFDIIFYIYIGHITIGSPL